MDSEEHYLLNKRVKILQPKSGYRAAIDSVFIAAAVKKIGKILDVGAGTGAISLCLQTRTATKKIYGLELQKDLYELAQASAKLNGFKNVEFINADIMSLPANLKNEFSNSFDAVVTNPPYSDDGLDSPNASKTLAHNEKSADLKTWLTFCLKMLKPKGELCLIHKTERLDEILHILHPHLGKIELFPLYSKSGQNSKRIILRGIKGSKTPLTLHPGIIVHNDDNSYSSYAYDILYTAKAID